MVNGQHLTTMVISSRPSRQDMGLCGLSQVITTSPALVKCWNFFAGPSVGFKREISAIYMYIPLDLDQFLNIGVQ